MFASKRVLNFSTLTKKNFFQCELFVFEEAKCDIRDVSAWVTSKNLIFLWRPKNQNRAFVSITWKENSRNVKTLLQVNKMEAQGFLLCICSSFFFGSTIWYKIICCPWAPGTEGRGTQAVRKFISMLTLWWNSIFIYWTANNWGGGERPIIKNVSPPPFVGTLDQIDFAIFR